MPLIAILIDLCTLFFYYLQLSSQNFYLIGLLIQAVCTFVLLIITFTYHGKRFGAIQPNFFYRLFSIRYGIIILSTIINGIVLFLYVLNYLGINNLIFTLF